MYVQGNVKFVIILSSRKRKKYITDYFALYIHIVTILWLNPIPARYLPFQIRFVSDSYEFADEAVNAPQGFKLQYRLQHCT